MQSEKQISGDAREKKFIKLASVLCVLLSSAKINDYDSMPLPVNTLRDISDTSIKHGVGIKCLEN